MLARGWVFRSQSQDSVLILFINMLILMDEHNGCSESTHTTSLTFFNKKKSCMNMLLLFCATSFCYKNCRFMLILILLYLAVVALSRILELKST